MRAHLFPAVLLVFVLAPGLSVQGAASGRNGDMGSRYGAAYEEYERALHGSRTAIDKAIERYEAILRDHPDEYLALAWLGSAYTIKARDPSVRNRMRWVRKGTDTLDRAVEADPDNPKIRLVRAVNSYHLPRVLDRNSVAERDFDHLFHLMTQHPGKFDDALRRSVFFHAGAHALKENRRRSVALLRKADEAPGDILNHEISRMLRLAEERFPDA